MLLALCSYVVSMVPPLRPRFAISCGAGGVSVVRRPTAVAVRDFCGSQRFYSFATPTRDLGTAWILAARWKSLAACKTLARRSRSSNHRGVGDFHHPGLLASRLSALWVEGPTRRSTDLSFRASPAWRVHFLYHWRVEPGTRTAPILGHRVVLVRWYPARFLKFCRRHGGEPHLPATGRTLRSRAGLDLGGVGGGGMPPLVTLAAPAELS